MKEAAVTDLTAVLVAAVAEARRRWCDGRWRRQQGQRQSVSGVPRWRGGAQGEGVCLFWFGKVVNYKTVSTETDK